MERDVIELAVAELRAMGDCIRGMAPCKVVLHIPPPNSGEAVTVELQAKLNREKLGLQ